MLSQCRTDDSFCGCLFDLYSFNFRRNVDSVRFRYDSGPTPPFDIEDVYDVNSLTAVT